MWIKNKKIKSLEQELYLIISKISRRWGNFKLKNQNYLMIQYA